MLHVEIRILILVGPLQYCRLCSRLVAKDLKSESGNKKPKGKGTKGKSRKTSAGKTAKGNLSKKKSKGAPSKKKGRSRPDPTDDVDAAPSAKKSSRKKPRKD